MRRAWLLGIVAAVSAFVACSDAGLQQPPQYFDPGTSGGTGDGGTGTPPAPGDDDDDAGTKPVIPVDAGPWGDPTTTHVEGKLRVEQLNVRRFFDAVCDSNNCAGANAYEDVATAASFDKRAQQIADDLATLQADVITLAEVEKQECLDLVQKKLQALGFTYPVAIVTSTGPGTVNTAVLARGKLDVVKTHRKENPLIEADGTTKTSFTRELPEVHLTLGTHKVIVFAAHFKSKASPDDPARRLAEGVGAHDIMASIGDANPTALVLLGGDLNDSPGSPPINALETDGKLLRVASDVTLQGTYNFQGSDQPIDHIFTTKNHKASYIAKSTTVVRDSGKMGFGGSDHATIYADFTLP